MTRAAADPTSATLAVQAPKQPRIAEGLDWSEAHELARDTAEPVFVPWSIYCDDRGWSLVNLLTGALHEDGQVNFSVQYPGIVKAWHRHRLQSDFWIVAVGALKAGVYREEDGAMWSLVFGEKRPGALIIPPPLWHGAATVGNQPAGLIYYVTRAYDASNPDEERRAWDSVSGFQWTPQHR